MKSGALFLRKNLTRFMNLRHIVLLLTGIFFAVLLGIGWLQHMTVVRMHQEGISAVMRASKFEVTALRAQVAFKKQVQEWKNVLIRGHNPDDRAKYWQSFLQEEARTRGLVEEIAWIFPQSSQIGALVCEFLDEHRKLGDRYRSALLVFSDGSNLAYQRSDALVRGQDRKPTNLFDKVLILVEEERANTILRTNTELAQKERWSRWYAAGAAGTAMLVLLLAMSKWITRPVNAAIHQAHCIADGDLDIRIKEGSILEIRNLQLALNSMAAQIKASYASIEASNQELIIARDIAVESSQLKSQFLTNMSHEIRTPLNGVIGMTRLLLAGSLCSEQREYAQMAHASGKMLLKLINDILDFSKIEAGKLDLEMLDFSLPGLLNEITDLLTISARAKGLQFSCTIAPGTPELLHGDPARLRQVLVNLAGNGIKFTEHGEVIVHVSRITASASGTVLRFSVRDTGIGIQADKQVLLFEKFSQVDASTTRHYGGSGLGLAISKQLVGLMDGEIGVSSGVGQGSEFWFTACFATALRSVPAALSAPVPQPAPSAPIPGHWPNLRVLLAEDNLINQKVAAGFLRKMGLPVDVVGDGRKAVDAIATTAYDLVLMDMQMPGMDGLEATRLIRAAHTGASQPRLPIIAMTANAMQKDRDRCLEAGMDDYLFKPITPESLASMLERWLPAPRHIDSLTL